MIQGKHELVSALGGLENISPQRMLLVDAIVRTRLLVDSCDAFILSQESVVNRRKRTLWPIVHQRQSLVDSLSKLLSQVGLERVPRAIKSVYETPAAIDSEIALLETLLASEPTQNASPAQQGASGETK
jgi:hypothetical protein